MPRSLDPSSRLTIVLASDADKPADVQPQIYARTLTLSQQRALLPKLSAMKESSGSDAMIEAALDAAEICLSGWRNMIRPDTGEAIEFSRQNIGDVLSIEELSEIFEFVSDSTKPTETDQKKSESPPS